MWGTVNKYGYPGFAATSFDSDLQVVDRSFMSASLLICKLLELQIESQVSMKVSLIQR